LPVHVDDAAALLEERGGSTRDRKELDATLELQKAITELLNAFTLSVKAATEQVKKDLR